MKHLNRIVVLIVFVQLIIITYLAFTFFQKERIVVIDVLKIVNEFEMKKDLEKQVEPSLIVLKNKRDSLNSIYEYSIKQNNLNTKVRDELFYWNQKLEEVYQKSNDEINQKVWNRLNPLIDKFGEMKKFKIIIGANGMGTVLYNNKCNDVTDEIITFINKQYREGEK